MERDMKSDMDDDFKLRIMVLVTVIVVILVIGELNVITNCWKLDKSYINRTRYWKEKWFKEGIP
jgi:hypothetical protein